MALPQSVEDALSDMTLSMVYAPGVPNNITAVQLAAIWLSSLNNNISTYNGYPIMDYVRNATKNTTITIDDAKDVLGKFALMKSDVWHGMAELWIIMVLISTPMLALRLYARIKHMGGLKKDDWLLIVAWVIATQNSGEDIYLMIAQHWDHHAWNGTRNMIRLHFWIGTVDDYLFPLSAFFYKSALVIFFHDLYRPKPFRYLCYLAEFLVFFWTLWNIIFNWYRCHPFNDWDNPFISECLPYTLKMFKGITLMNVCNDIILLSLPIIITFQLKMPVRRKVGVTCLMGLGSVVCVASIMRYTTLEYWITTHDVLWRSIPVTTWSLLEPHLGIVCASVPAVWKLYNLFLKPKVDNFMHQHISSSSEKDASSSSGSSAMARSFGSFGNKKPEGDLTRIMNMRTDLESGVNGTIIGYDPMGGPLAEEKSYDLKKQMGQEDNSVLDVPQTPRKIIGADEMRILHRDVS